MIANLQDVTPEQSSAICKSFVAALGNPLLTDWSVFYAGMSAFFATMREMNYSQEQIDTAFQRLKKLST